MLRHFSPIPTEKSEPKSPQKAPPKLQLKKTVIISSESEADDKKSSCEEPTDRGFTSRREGEETSRVEMETSRPLNHEV